LNEDDPKGVLGRLFGGWNRMRENALADIALGFTPAGVAADVQDAKRAIENRDAIGLGLAGVGFLPGGDIAKAVAKRLPRRVLEDAPQGTLSLKRILSGDVNAPSSGSAMSGSYDPSYPGRAAEYAAKQYDEAFARGIPMDPESVAKRRAEQFPLEGYHGTKVFTDTENVIGRDLMPQHPLVENRSFFAGVGESGQDVASSYNAFDLGDVVPVSIDPGRYIEVDALGNAYSSVPLESTIEALMKSGDLGEDEIVDLLIGAEPELWFDVVGSGRKNIDDRVDYLYRAMDPEFNRAFDEFRLPDELSADDLGNIAKLGGYDSAIIRNVLDKFEADSFLSGLEIPADEIVIPNPIGRVRHRSAVFDPEKKNLGNLFAGIAGASIGGSALARALQENRREEY